MSLDLCLLVSRHRIVDSCLNVSSKTLITLMLMVSRLGRRSLLYSLDDLLCWLLRRLSLCHSGKRRECIHHLELVGDAPVGFSH